MWVAEDIEIDGHGSDRLLQTEGGNGEVSQDEWNEDIQVLLLSGRFDKAARISLKSALTAGEVHPRTQVILDFSNVSFVDSAILAKCYFPIIH